MSIERLIECREDMRNGDFVHMPAIPQVLPTARGIIDWIEFDPTEREFGVLTVYWHPEGTLRNNKLQVDMGISEGGPTQCIEIGPGFFIVAFPRGGPLIGGLVLLVAKPRPL
jgi:hypothetical protein